MGLGVEDLSSDVIYAISVGTLSDVMPQIYMSVIFEVHSEGVGE
jgi:hypothetical protein